jgi:hypothetical protein
VTMLASINMRIDATVNWIAANARSFSYVLPDTLELMLYLGLVAYFAQHFAQQPR